MLYIVSLIIVFCVYLLLHSTIQYTTTTIQYFFIQDMENSLIYRDRNLEKRILYTLVLRRHLINKVLYGIFLYSYTIGRIYKYMYYVMPESFNKVYKPYVCILYIRYCTLEYHLSSSLLYHYHLLLRPSSILLFVIIICENSLIYNVSPAHKKV